MSKGIFRRLGTETDNRILPIYAPVPESSFKQGGARAKLSVRAVPIEEFAEELLALPLPDDKRESLSSFFTEVKQRVKALPNGRGLAFGNLYEKQTLSLHSLFSVLEMLSSSHLFRVEGLKEPDGVRLSLPLFLLALSKLLAPVSRENAPSTIKGLWESGEFLLELIPGNALLSERVEKDPALERIEAAGAFWVEPRDTAEGRRFYFHFLMGKRTSPAFYQVGRVWILPWFISVYEASRKYR